MQTAVRGFAPDRRPPGRSVANVAGEEAGCLVRGDEQTHLGEASLRQGASGGNTHEVPLIVEGGSPAVTDRAPRQWRNLQLEFDEALYTDSLPSTPTIGGLASCRTAFSAATTLGETRLTWPPVSMIALNSAEWIVPASETVAVVVGRLSGGRALAEVPLPTAVGRDRRARPDVP